MRSIPEGWTRMQAGRYKSWRHGRLVYRCDAGFWRCTTLVGQWPLLRIACAYADERAAKRVPE